jgi:hypothetical protein
MPTTPPDSGEQGSAPGPQIPAGRPGYRGGSASSAPESVQGPPGAATTREAGTALGIRPCLLTPWGATTSEDVAPPAPHHGRRGFAPRLRERAPDRT